MRTSPALSLTVSFILAVGLGAATATANDFINGGFENGTFDGWIQAGGVRYLATNYPADYTFTGGPFQSAVISWADPVNVPCLEFRGAAVPQVRTGRYAARVNSDDGGGFDFSQIMQTVTNWDSVYFSFDWSAVLQDSGHLRVARPHFRVMLDNATRGTNIYNLLYFSDNLPPGMVMRTGPDPADYTYTGWRHVQLNTPGMTGENLTLTILASDCSEGGHDGALYVDNVAGSPKTGNALPVAVPQVIPNRGAPGTPIMLIGAGSYDPDADPIDMYDWDFDGDGITDLYGPATIPWLIPTNWAPGTYALRLRVRETPPVLPAQWSPWASATFTVLGPPDAAHSTISPARSLLPADGTHTQVITVQARDVADNIVTNSGDAVVILRSSGTGTITATTDNGNGTYTAKVKAPATPGSGVFTALMGGTPVGTAAGAQQSVVNYLPRPPLSAVLTPTNTVLVTWPWSELSYRLQTASELLPGGAGWSDCSYSTNGMTCFHLESSSTGNQFYRLKFP